MQWHPRLAWGRPMQRAEEIEAAFRTCRLRRVRESGSQVRPGGIHKVFVLILVLITLALSQA